MTFKHLSLIDLILLAFLLWAPYANAQVYVRPSKGTPVHVLTFQANGIDCTYPNGTESPACQTKAMDMSSFTAVEVVLRGSLTKIGLSFPLRFYRVPQFLAFGVTPYTVAGSTDNFYTIAAYGTTNKSAAVGVYDLTGEAAFAHFSLGAQDIEVVVTGIPFSSEVAVLPRPCGALSKHDATNIQNDGGYISTNYRWYNYIVVTNSSQNTAGNLKCRQDGVIPSMALSFPGDYLQAGQSIKYATDMQIACVSDVGA